MAEQTPTTALGFDNFFQASLTGDITASSTDILMDAIPTASEGFLVIEPDSANAREIIYYNSKTALKVVCPSAAARGQGGTTAGAHSTGATVIMAPIAEMFEALQNGYAINAKALKFNTPQGFMQNGKIERSVASNNLTVAIKTLAGNDPSTSDPVIVRIGDSIRTITSALSITINAGTNWWGMGASYFASTDQDFFCYLIWNTTDSAVTIAVAREPDMRVYSDRHATSTNHGYLVSSGSAPASTDEMEVVGRFNATLGPTASFNWSLPATAVIVNYPIFETRTFSFTNSGSAGGTHYCKQVGSVKRVWGVSASFSTSTGTTNVVLTFPAGYFSAIESCVGATRSAASIAQQFFVGNGISTTQWAYYIFCQSGSGSATAGVEVIGS